MRNARHVAEKHECAVDLSGSGNPRLERGGHGIANDADPMHFGRARPVADGKAIARDDNDLSDGSGSCGADRVADQRFSIQLS